jgi:hypothetical protein
MRTVEKRCETNTAIPPVAAATVRAESAYRSNSSCSAWGRAPTPRAAVDDVRRSAPVRRRDEAAAGCRQQPHDPDPGAGALPQVGRDGRWRTAANNPALPPS